MTPVASRLEAPDPDTGAAANIADRLAAVARHMPDKPAVIWYPRAGRRVAPTARSRTFSELNEQTDRYARGLHRAGIGRDTRVILFVQPGFEFFALVFALFRVGAVVVMIDPGMGRSQLCRCLSGARAQAFVGVPAAHLFRLLHKASFRSVQTCVTVGRRWGWGGLELADLDLAGDGPPAPAGTAADDTAAILFTSGSTGPAKGVVYTHATFDAQVRYLNRHFGYGPDEIDVATFPLFALFDAALGMTAIIPAMDFSRPGEVDPEAIIGPIMTHRATHMFGSPALIDRVSRHAARTGTRLTSIKRVMTAGAPVQPATLERMQRVLADDALIHTPYGATEALPVASINSREILGDTAQQTGRGAGVCVGRCIDGVDVRIIRINDEPIRSFGDDLTVPRGQVGEIVVRGPAVTRAYFNQPDATELAKIPDRATFWHRMGDLGYFDERGRLWFCGRKSQRVRTARGDLYTVCCEQIFNVDDSVRRSALVGVGPPGAMTPVLCVELEPGVRRGDYASVVRRLLDRAAAHPRTEAIRRVLFHKRFPVDVRHNAKIFREKLAPWAAEKLGAG